MVHIISCLDYPVYILFLFHATNILRWSLVGSYDNVILDSFFHWLFRI